MKTETDMRMERGNEIKKDFDNHIANTGRENREVLWREVALRCYPGDRQYFNRSEQMNTKGERKTSEIYDTKPVTALNRFAAISNSLITPYNAMWHLMECDNPELNKIREVRIYFEEVNKALFKQRYRHTAGFIGQNAKIFESVGAFGIGSLFVDAHESGVGLRYKNIHLGQFYPVENHQGTINKVFRYYTLTAEQAYEEFGELLPDEIKNVIKQTPNKEFFFIHRVRPRKDRDPMRKDYKGMAYQSEYMSVTGNLFLSEGGYTSFPYPNMRYRIVDKEVYPESPAIEALPSIKTLMEQKKAFLKQGHRALDPILLLADDGVLDSFSLRPGAANYGAVSQDGRPLVHTLPFGRLDLSKEMLAEERESIADAFYLSIFQILMETPTMTATEVIQRAKEQAQMTTPIFGKMESDYVGSLVDRELDILAKQGQLPAMPSVLIEAAKEYKLIHKSPLAEMQNSPEIAGVMKTVDLALNVAERTGDMSKLDHFEFDEIIPAVAQYNGMSARFIRSKSKIEEIRAARDQQMAEQQAMQAAPGQAALIKAGTQAAGV